MRFDSRSDSAERNCSTIFGTAECISSSGCQGGAELGAYCAEGLSGPLCRLCSSVNVSKPVHYVPATDNRVAHCEPCDSLVSTAVVDATIATAAILFALLALLALWRHLLPKGAKDAMLRLWRASRPETKTKIVVAFCKAVWLGPSPSRRTCII